MRMTGHFHSATRERHLARPLVATAFISLLVLSGCATPESAPDAAPTDSTAPSASATTEPATAPPTPENNYRKGVNCASMVSDDRALRMEKENSAYGEWEIKSQIAVYGGDFDFGARIGLDPIDIDRAMSCEVSGAPLETGIVWTYIESPDYDPEAIREAAIALGYEDRGEISGVQYLLLPGGSHSDGFFIFGDDWFITGGSGLLEEYTLGMFGADLRDASPEDYAIDTHPQRHCSMFFDSASWQGGDEPAFARTDYGGLGRTMTSDESMIFQSDHGPNREDLCEQIEWHDESAEAAGVLPGGAPVATNEQCEIYARGDQFLTDCGENGYGIISAPEAAVKYVLPPKYRGFKE